MGDSHRFRVPRPGVQDCPWGKEGGKPRLEPLECIAVLLFLSGDIPCGRPSLLRLVRGRVGWLLLLALGKHGCRHCIC